MTFGKHDNPLILLTFLFCTAAGGRSSQCQFKEQIFLDCCGVWAFPFPCQTRYNSGMKKTTSYAQKLFTLLHHEFSIYPDSRKNPTISLKDAAMSALGMFSLKMPSLLKFDNECRLGPGKETVKSLFGLDHVPSDTQMRTILDQVPHRFFYKSFKALFNFLCEKKRLSDFVFLKSNKTKKKNFYLMPVDATSFFSSQKIQCPSCLSSSKGTSKERYQHQFLASVLVHPKLKTVLPMGAELISNGDEHKGNRQDSELNAFKRLIVRI